MLMTAAAPVKVAAARVVVFIGHIQRVELRFPSMSKQRALGAEAGVKKVTLGGEVAEVDRLADGRNAPFELS